MAAKTTKIRIAVAVSPNGEWAAAGYSGAETDQDNRDMVFIDALPDGEQFYWVEAEVPIPHEITIKGNVS